MAAMLNAPCRKGRRHPHVAPLPSILLAVALFVACSVLAAAANDPGHDTLYVLKMGDSNVTGTINISQNLSAQIVRANFKFWGDYLDVVANGTITTPSSPISAIQAASNSLYIDSSGNVYINTKAGTSGIIQLGDAATNGITLNVSGTIRQQGVGVCLANGTNCASGNNTGNVTSVSKGDSSPLTISPTTGAVSVTMSQAGSGTSGWLSSANWTTFNNKAGTGTATCAAGTLAQNVTTSTGGITSQCMPVGTGNGSVTSVGLSRTGTTAVTITNSPITSSGTINLAFQNATSGQDGLLKSADWTTFNNKAANGSSAACTYGIANITLNSAGVPTVTCAAQQGTGTGNITGGGTSGTLTKWTGAGTIGNSIVSESGSTATVNGNLLLGSNAIVNTTSGNLTIDSAGGYVIINIG